MLLPHPFSRYLQVLTGASRAAEAETAFEELAAAAPDAARCRWCRCSRPGALTTGRFEWAERAARKGIEADPESTFSFWGRGLQGYLAAALIEQGRYDEGLAALDVAIDRFVEAGGRTGVVVYKGPGRRPGRRRALDAAAKAVTSAYKELETYGERFAEPLVLEADARFRHAAGEPGAEDLLARPPSAPPQRRPRHRPPHPGHGRAPAHPVRSVASARAAKYSRTSWRQWSPSRPRITCGPRPGGWRGGRPPPDRPCRDTTAGPGGAARR